MPDFEDDMTDADLNQPATKRDLRALREELRQHIDERSAELRRHFDVTAESFKSDFANLFDWTQSTTSTMGKRIDGVQSRVTRLERRSKR
jgi:hypothetical protein